jgi:hypothetical protein
MSNAVIFVVGTIVTLLVAAYVALLSIAVRAENSRRS